MPLVGQDGIRVGDKESYGGGGRMAAVFRILNFMCVQYIHLRFSTGQFVWFGSKV